ncbi:MAG TPA: hypothetical protein VK716_17410 [Terracidiphilus sp.]|jgi:CheY-like chemotaxis protein|nr:hypothetical protein [Terracidiphilus sp.]
MAGNRLPSILCAGADAQLLATRVSLLQSLGAPVLSAINLTEAIQRLSEQRFQLMILCHSLQQAEAAALCNAASEQNPPIFILQVAKCFGRQDDRAHIVCDALVDADPVSLTQCVREILRRVTANS